MSANDVTITESVGSGGRNLQHDKIPIKMLLNKFISAGKLPGVDVLVFGGGDGVSEPSLNKAIQTFQDRFVPIGSSDGRIDRRNSETLKVLNKNPSTVKLKREAYEKVSYLKGSVGRPTGSVKPENKPADVMWVQKRLNVKIHFGMVPGFGKTDFVPSTGKIRTHRIDDPTLVAIQLVQNRVLSYGIATGTIEPGDGFDQWLQDARIHLPDVYELVDSNLTTKQKVDRRLYDAIHSDYFDRTHNRWDPMIKQVVEKLLRKDADDSFVRWSEVERYTQTTEIRPFTRESFKQFLYFSNANPNSGLLKDEVAWVDFLRDHLADELCKKPKAYQMAARGDATAEERGRAGLIAKFWKDQSNKPNSLYSAPLVAATMGGDDPG